MNGQGEAARAFVDDLMKKDEKFVLLDFYETLHKRIPRQEENKYRKYYLKKFIYRTNIFFVALDLLIISRITYRSYSRISTISSLSGGSLKAGSKTGSRS